MKRTAEDFEKSVKEKGISFWRIHECSICEYPCGFLFRSGRCYYDSGCDCVNYGPVIEPRSWDEVLEQYNFNAQYNPHLMDEINKFWGFSDEDKLPLSDTAETALQEVENIQ